MSTLEDAVFEIERRVILFKSTTTMPDSSVLGFNGDPNTCTGSGTPGEVLIYNSPVGTRYQQDDGTQWYKKTMPNVWEVFGSNAAGDTNSYVFSRDQGLYQNQEIWAGGTSGEGGQAGWSVLYAGRIYRAALKLNGGALGSKLRLYKNLDVDTEIVGSTLGYVESQEAITNNKYAVFTFSGGIEVAFGDRVRIALTDWCNSPSVTLIVERT